MNVALPEYLEDFVAREVEKGHYVSAEEMIGAALRALMEEDAVSLSLHQHRQGAYKVADGAFWQGKIERLTQKFGNTIP